MTARKPNWQPYGLTTPVTKANNPSIDPRPAESAAKHAKLTGQGCAIPRNLSLDKGYSR